MPYKDPLVRSQKSYERAKKWRKANPERYRAEMRKWQDRHPDYFLWYSAKRRAKRDGVEFTITREDVKNVPTICPIALIPLQKRLYVAGSGQTGPVAGSPSVDRVDPTKGYTPGNVRIISHKGNRMKGELTIADLERIIAYMKEEQPM